MLDRLLYHLAIPKLNIIKTLYFNYKLLPLKDAIKLPIFIYGPVKIYWLKGKVKLHTSNIYRGMIKLGCNNEFFNGIDNSSFIYITEGSTIIFEGPCAISNNYKIRVSNKSTLTFGKYTFLGSSIKVVCTKGIKIGEYSRCGYESQIIDTNSHFVININDGEVTRRDGYIKIGNYNWIGNRCSITKDTQTKDNTIVCAYSLLNKDYTTSINDYPMLGGIPAKEIKCGYKRIYSTEIENKLEKLFNKTTSSKTYITESFKDDLSSIEYWFKNIM